MNAIEQIIAEVALCASSANEPPATDAIRAQQHKLMTAAPRLTRALKKAVGEIDDAPHAPECDMHVVYGRPGKPKCDCWKSRALATITAELTK